jgi:CIC family chloride channel protein
MLGGFWAAVSHLPSDVFVVLGMAATFGAAARVPIASLMMVTEMTGEYRLLPPAAFAVLLSYLVQTRLAANLKYSSLYEAQVPGRAHSPARYEENVQVALDLLGKRQIPRAVKVGHLDLVALLDSGIPIWLPGRKKLSVGVLRAQSALVGQTIASCYKSATAGALEIVAILRGAEIVLPTPDAVLQENDRLLVFGSSEAQAMLAEHLTPVESRNSGALVGRANDRTTER